MPSIWSNLVNPNVTPMPIVLRTTAVIPPSAAGVTVPATFDSTKVQNTLRVPIDVTEILVTVFDRTWEDGSVIQPCQHGSGVEIDLGVGRYRMTDGFVPFAVFAPWNSADVMLNWASEDQTDADPSNAGWRTVRRIVLSQPIRLAPGVGFSGRVRRRPPSFMVTETTGSQVVALTLIGRAAPSGPRGETVQRVPFWSHARFELRTGSPLPFTVESTEDEFVNPLTSTFDVLRIIAAPITTLYNGAVGCRIHCDLDQTGGINPPNPSVQLRWPNGDLLNTDRVLNTISPFLRNWSYSHPFALAPTSRVRASLTVDTITYGYDWLMALYGTRREVL